jgi:hypothetical protein
VAFCCLKGHPNPQFRLEVIVELLSESSDPIKEVATAWLKYEVLEGSELDTTESELQNPFVSHECLVATLPLIFSPIDHPSSAVADEAMQESYSVSYGFRAAALNFLYLLMCREDIRKPLGVDLLLARMDFEPTFLEPLKRLSTDLQKSIINADPEKNFQVTLLLDGISRIEMLLRA